MAKPTVWLDISTPNHARILRDVMPVLSDSGVGIEIIAYKGAARHQQTLDWAAESGLAIHRYTYQMDRAAYGQAGDVMLLWGLGIIHIRSYLDRLAEKGVTVLQGLDGGRFGQVIHHDPRVPVLGWGPSATGYGAPAQIVGSPVIEAAAARGRGERRGEALINVKAANKLPGIVSAWTKKCVAAAERAGLTPVLSIHPRFIPEDLRGKASDEPFDDLLHRAEVLISGPSTCVYEALAAGVPVILAPSKDEILAEFETPLSAFPTVWKREGLDRMLKKVVATGRVGRTEPFLSMHVHMDPDKPAALRMAEAILDAAGMLLR